METNVKPEDKSEKGVGDVLVGLSVAHRAVPAARLRKEPRPQVDCTRSLCPTDCVVDAAMIGMDFFKSEGHGEPSGYQSSRLNKVPKTFSRIFEPYFPLRIAVPTPAPNSAAIWWRRLDSSLYCSAKFLTLVIDARAVLRLSDEFKSLLN